MKTKPINQTVDPLVVEAIQRAVDNEALVEWSKTKNAPLISKQISTTLIKKSLIKRLPSLLI